SQCGTLLVQVLGRPRESGTHEPGRSRVLGRAAQFTGMSTVRGVRSIPILLLLGAFAGPGRAGEAVLLRKSIEVRASNGNRAVYRYVEFVVPPGARELEISVDYPDAGTAAAKWGPLDIGVFGPHDSFRGWSGGRHEIIVLGEDLATPGYSPGPIT